MTRGKYKLVFNLCVIVLLINVNNIECRKSVGGGGRRGGSSSWGSSGRVSKPKPSQTTFSHSSHDISSLSYGNHEPSGARRPSGQPKPTNTHTNSHPDSHKPSAPSSEHNNYKPSAPRDDNINKNNIGWNTNSQPQGQPGQNIGWNVPGNNQNTPGQNPSNVGWNVNKQNTPNTQTNVHNVQNAPNQQIPPGYPVQPPPGYHHGQAPPPYSYHPNPGAQPGNHAPPGYNAPGYGSPPGYHPPGYPGYQQGHSGYPGYPGYPQQGHSGYPGYSGYPQQGYSGYPQQQGFGGFGGFPGGGFGGGFGGFGGGYNNNNRGGGFSGTSLLTGALLGFTLSNLMRDNSHYHYYYPNSQTVYKNKNGETLNVIHNITGDQGSYASYVGNMTCISMYNAKAVSQWANSTLQDFYKTYPSTPFPVNINSTDAGLNFTVIPGEIIHNETLSVTCCGTDKGQVNLVDLTNGKATDVNCIFQTFQMPFRKMKFIPVNNTMNNATTPVPDTKNSTNVVSNNNTISTTEINVTTIKMDTENTTIVTNSTLSPSVTTIQTETAMPNTEQPTTVKQ